MSLLYRLLCLLFLLVKPCLILAATPEPPHRPSDYVVDLAGIINDDVRRKLNLYLMELEKKTTAQIVILTVKSLDGETIEDFSLRMAEKWKLGKKEKDNGLLITVSLLDRKYRFETGYGLEGILPDSLLGTIGRHYMVPFFRNGDFSTGIINATIIIGNIIAKHEGVEIKSGHGIIVREPPVKSNLRDFIIIFVVSNFILISLLFTLLPRLGRRRVSPPYWYMGGAGLPWGGFGGSGGFGGTFGGGGGGGFGGGGASGGW